MGNFSFFYFILFTENLMLFVFLFNDTVNTKDTHKYDFGFSYYFILWLEMIWFQMKEKKEKIDLTEPLIISIDSENTVTSIMGILSLIQRIHKFILSFISNWLDLLWMVDIKQIMVFRFLLFSNGKNVKIKNFLLFSIEFFSTILCVCPQAYKKH